MLVDVGGRSLIVSTEQLSPAVDRRRRLNGRDGAQQQSKSETRTARAAVASEVDLHGLTVERALERAERALDDALRGDLEELRFIHGKSGGRIRAALHRWLKAISSVRSFRVDPRNDGVTIVTL